MSDDTKCDANGVSYEAICANCGQKNGAHSWNNECPNLDDEGEVKSFNLDSTFKQVDDSDEKDEGVIIGAMDEAEYQLLDNNTHCGNCEHRKGSHSWRTPHRCLSSEGCNCMAFNLQSKSFEDPSRVWYNPMKDPVWRSVNPDAFRAHPEVFSRFANWLAIEPDNEKRMLVWSYLTRSVEELTKNQSAYNRIKPHELVIGLACHKRHNDASLWIYGAACADPQYPSMLSIRMTNNGLRYEVDGVWLHATRGIELNGWATKAICHQILPVSIAEASLSKLKSKITYSIGKNIWG